MVQPRVVRIGKSVLFRKSVGAISQVALAFHEGGTHLHLGMGTYDTYRKWNMIPFLYTTIHKLLIAGPHLVKMTSASGQGCVYCSVQETNHVPASVCVYRYLHQGCDLREAGPGGDGAAAGGDGCRTNGANHHGGRTEGGGALLFSGCVGPPIVAVVRGGDHVPYLRGGGRCCSHEAHLREVRKRIIRRRIREAGALSQWFTRERCRCTRSGCCSSRCRRVWRLAPFCSSTFYRNLLRLSILEFSYHRRAMCVFFPVGVLWYVLGVGLCTQHRVYAEAMRDGCRMRLWSKRRVSSSIVNMTTA